MHNRIRLILLDSISETIFYFIVHNDAMCRGVAQKATPTQKVYEWVWFVGVVWFCFQFSGNMSWFDSSLSFAKTAFSQAQKSIDKVLDISETEQQQEGKGGGGEKSRTREHYIHIS